MFELRLYFRPRGTLPVLRFSWGFRIVFLTLTAFIILAMVSSGSAPIMGIILVAITLAGSLFEESWRWNSDLRQLEHRSGLLFINRLHIFPAEEISNFELRTFARGTHRPQKASATPQSSDTGMSPEIPRRLSLDGRIPLLNQRLIRLSFEHREAGTIIMEHHTLRDRDDLPTAATAFAEILSCTLIKIDE